MRFIFRFLVGVLAVVGLLVVLAAGGIWWLVTHLERGAMEIAAARMPDAVVLEVDLRSAPGSGPPRSSVWTLIDGRRATLFEVIEAIDRGAEDARVKSLLIELGGDAFGLATASEIRDAVGRFREAGKPVVVQSESLGEFGAGNVSYFLASAASEIRLTAGGTVGLTGVRVSVPFAREALDEIGVVADVVHVGEYKSAPETFTETDFTPAHREMTEALVGDLYDQIARAIADGRSLDRERVDAIIDGGPYDAPEAVRLGLVDRIASRAETRDELKDQAGGDEADFLDPAQYLARAGDAGTGGDTPVIALVHASGAIAPSDGGDIPFAGDMLAAERLVETIDEAAEDEDIRAIVLRINSPGGSAVASETVADAVTRARAAGKPVVVSMGEAAASGGYMISAPADLIVAAPGTLTGSIGVFAGKPVLAGAWERIGISWGAVARGANADIWSTEAAFDPSERARVETIVGGVYDRFIGIVARGRGLTEEEVRAVAAGRVWTGRQALDRRLVDRLGGIREAVGEARRLAGLEEGEAIELRHLPRAGGPLQEILSRLEGPLGADASLLPAEIRQVARPLAVLSLLGDGPLAWMPPYRLAPAGP